MDFLLKNLLYFLFCYLGSLFLKLLLLLLSFFGSLLFQLEFSQLELLAVIKYVPIINVFLEKVIFIIFFLSSSVTGLKSFTRIIQLFDLRVLVITHIENVVWILLTVHAHIIEGKVLILDHDTRGQRFNIGIIFHRLLNHWTYNF